VYERVLLFFHSGADKKPHAGVVANVHYESVVNSFDFGGLAFGAAQPIGFGAFNFGGNPGVYDSTMLQSLIAQLRGAQVCCHS
jgi:hypothetical protein